MGIDDLRRNPEPTRPVSDPWKIEARDVAVGLMSDPSTGLAPEEARARRERYGPNELRARAAKPVWRLFVEQFTNAMILVLIAAAAITAAIGDLKDTVVILAIVALNGIVGFVQEYRAEKAMDALKRMTSPSTRVVRGGETVVVPATELVPGDVVRLDAGDVVTADLRLLEAQSLRINEAALTGESEPASKTTAPLPACHRRAPRRPAEHGLQRNGRDVRARPRGWSSRPAWGPRWVGWPNCSRSMAAARHRSSDGSRRSASGWRSRAAGGRASSSSSPGSPVANRSTSCS